jgi:hypothetical protein
MVSPADIYPCHAIRARLEVGGAFTAFAGSESEPFKIPTHHPGWWPSALIFGIAGLLIGTVAGLTLTRFGWAIVRVGRKIS